MNLINNNKRHFAWVSLLVLLTLGCASEPPTESTTVAPTITIVPTSQAAAAVTVAAPPTSESNVAEQAAPTATSAPAEALPAVQFSAESRLITFTTGDGLQLVGTFYPAGSTGPAPTVLLLHMLNSNRGVWADFATKLNANGYNALALDMRGHGDTGGQMNWELARADHLLVLSELNLLPEVDPQRTAVIGGSIGSNMALILGKDMPPLIRTVALLSPGLDYRGVSTDDAMGAYGDRPVLIVASNEDGYSADSSRQLADLALNGELIMYDGAGHGTNMFDQMPELTETLIDWLNTHTSN